MRTLKREKWFLMWQHKSGSQIKCQSYFHSKNKICWQHQSSHLLRDLDTKKCKLLRFHLFFWAIHKWLTIFDICKNDDPQVWKVVICGREGLERQEKWVTSLMDDPYLKLLCKKHNDQSHVFVVRDVSHIHMYAHAQWIIAVLNIKHIKVGRCSIHTKLFLSHFEGRILAPC